MRNYNSIFHLRNALTGVVCASHSTAATVAGQPIDIIGFNDMLAILCVGSLKGSGASDRAADLTVKFQTAATSAATGSDWSDITDGAINGTASVYGSAKFDVLQVVGGSVAAAAPFYQRKLYCLLNQQVGMKRYIRVHASITGSASSILQASISVPVLLGKPRQSDYIIDATGMGNTYNADVQYGFKFGSTPGM